LMVLGVPTFDAIFTILRRIHAGKSPFWGDRGHLHHKLLDVLGWSKQKIAIFYWSSSLVLGVLSLYLNSLGKLITLGLVLCLTFGFLVWAKIKTIMK
jgi:UDP-GlcNAc:undecaprenyl-phosphate/decaprenyl-phosphate GlcNAc-1-phosphate transferase